MRFGTSRAEGLNPFLALLELLRHGAWPLGQWSGAVYVYVLGEPGPAGGGFEFAPQFELQPATVRARIYASAEFRDEKIVRSWHAWLQTRDWELVHERVNENQGPPEFLLGRKIRECAGVLGLALAEAEFGLPWWVFQELDFAEACGRPVALVTASELLQTPGAREVEEWLENLERKP